MADKAEWRLTPKGATVSDLMLAVSARRNMSDCSMRALTFSPDLPLSPKSPGTAVLTGWAFVRRSGPIDVLDGAVLLHLGPANTSLNLSSLLPGSDSGGGWQLTARFQPAGEAALP